MSNEPILRYAVTSDPFPLQASPATGNLTTARLTLVVSNPTNDPVKLQGLILSLPVGTDATDLTPASESIGPLPAANWSLHDTQTPTGAVRYNFQPDPGHEQVSGEGLTFRFENVELNRQVGTAQVTVIEGSQGCQPADCPQATLYVAKFPDGWGQVSFWADPITVAYDSGPALHWDGPAGATYGLEYYTPQQGLVNIPVPGAPPLANSGQYPGQNDPPLALEQTTTFTLNVSERIANQQLTAQRQATVTVETPPPQITLFRGKIAYVEGSPQVILQWETKYAERVSIEGDAHALNPSSLDDSYKIIPSPANPLPTSYRLTVANATGQATSQLSLVWAPRGTPIPLGKGPFSLTLTPDGRALYVTNHGDNNVSVIDTAAGTPHSNPIGVRPGPFGLALTPDGRWLYVASDTVGSLLGPFTKSLTVIDTTTNAPHGNPISLTGGVGQGPRALAVTPDGRRLYAANSTLSTTLTVVDIMTNTPQGAPIKIGGTNLLDIFATLALTPDGRWLYIPLTLRNKVMVFDPQTNQPQGDPIPVGRSPIALAVTPDSRRLYVANRDDNTLTMIDTSSHQPLGAPIPVGRTPLALAVTADGGQVFVSNQDDNTVTVIDTASNQPLGKPIPVGPAPLDLAVTPDGGRVFVINTGSDNLTVMELADLVKSPAPAVDDLTRVEGVGPKITILLQETGITTHSQLAATPVDRLRQILRQARLWMADPTTWPEQAALAAAGDWQALQDLQDKLKGGRRAE